MKRFDGRDFDELRRISIKKGFIKYAEGSCLIEVGNTRVICTATLDKNVPSFLKGTSSGWVTAEYGMLPRATQTRNLRDRISGRSMEIQRLIGRSLRSAVDLKKLGEMTIWIDCDVVQADGGTRTTSIIGGFVALVEALYKLYKNKVIDEFPLNSLLGAVSVGIWRQNYILDLTFQEDSEVEVDMNIVMKSNGEFVEIQGTAEKKSFSKKDLEELLNLAKKGIERIISLEKEIFKDMEILQSL